MRNLLRLIDRFRRDRRGNLAVIFTLAAIPLVSALGSAVDYSMATRMKAKLQSAADAASVASISQNSAGYLAASQMTGDGTITAGVNDATKIFNGNMSGFTGYTLTPAPAVTKTGIKLNSTISFSAQVPTTFMKVIGYQTLTVTGTSKSTASLPPYLDFYLMLDVSGSMGLPSTDGEETRLAAVNPDNFTQYPKGCTFACHFATSCGDTSQKYSTKNWCLSYRISRISQAGYQGLLANNSGKLPAYRISGNPIENTLYPYNPLYPKDPLLSPVQSCTSPGTDACIQLRADAVGYALTTLFQYANTYEKVPKQFRIGLYPFIRYLYTYFALTSSIGPSDSITTAANNLATLLDTGNNTNLGSGGTHFENAFPTMSTTITSVGNGSTSTNTQPYVFLVTDGSQNFQTQWGGSWAGNNGATVMPSGALSPCKPLRDRGIIVSVLYIPYQPIQNPTSFANSEDYVANANIPNIPPSLTNCASPPDTGGSYFYTANTPQDIQDSLKAMFNHAVQTAHLTP
jgi:Flp pilus assembly protein TadG